MDEDLQLDVGHLAMYLGNLVDRQFTGQHHPPETYGAQPTDLPHRAVVGLRGGMKGYGRQRHLENAHVLDKDGVDANLCKLTDKLLRGLQLVVIKDGVNRNVDAGLELVGIAAEALNVLDAIAGGGTRPEARGANIDGIGAMVYGSHATLQVPGRSQQFQRLHLIIHYQLSTILSD